jgi:hypothetical protein
MFYCAGIAAPFKYSNMGKHGKPSEKRKQGESEHHNQKQKPTAHAAGVGGVSSHEHQHDDKSSVQSNEVVLQRQESDPSSSGSQVGTQMKHSGENECKELTSNTSITGGLEMSDIWCCTVCRVILKEMIDSHPQKDDFMAKLERHHFSHAVECNQTAKGSSGEQKSDVRVNDIESVTENQPEGLPAKVSTIHVFVLGRGNKLNTAGHCGKCNTVIVCSLELESYK